MLVTRSNEDLPNRGSMLTFFYISSSYWTSCDGYNSLTSANRRAQSGGTWLFRMVSSLSMYACQRGAKRKAVDLVRRLWVTIKCVSESPSRLSSHRKRDSGSPWGNIGLREICHSYSKTRWRSQTRISPVTWDPDTVLTRSVVSLDYCWKLARVDECRNWCLYLFRTLACGVKTPSMTQAFIMFACCLTRDCGSGKYLRTRSYVFSNAHTWFSC